jgi:hypothetical protein
MVAGMFFHLCGWVHYSFVASVGLWVSVLSSQLHVLCCEAFVTPFFLQSLTNYSIVDATTYAVSRWHYWQYGCRGC